MKTTCRIADLKYKEVINIATGERLGYVNDVEINMKSGEIAAIIVPGPLKFWGILGRHEDIIIPWEHIDKIGDDIILVHHSCYFKHAKNHRTVQESPDLSDTDVRSSQ